MFQSKMGNASQPIELDAKQESESPEIPEDMFAVLKERKRRGLWSGSVEHIEFKEHNLTSGKHYYVMSDVRKREIHCTSCSVKHGGILEAKLLTRYRIEDGVLYLDNKACNEIP